MQPRKVWKIWKTVVFHSPELWKAILVRVIIPLINFVMIIFTALTKRKLRFVSRRQPVV